MKKILIIIAVILCLVSIFLLARGVPQNYLKRMEITLSLPLITFLIALVDGFNPCTIWVLSFLLVLLTSVSYSRERLFIVGFSFLAVVFIIYFLFMAAWLNLFLVLGYVRFLRITVAIIALVAGLINCKELFLFGKGPSLMIGSKDKIRIVKKIEDMKKFIKKGSLHSLIISSMGLAAFASLVEIPCTAGWPVLYTKILSEKVLQRSILFYTYLLFYNLIYIIPLFVIVIIFIYFLKGRKLTQRQGKIIKFAGGFLMIALGIILLVNPGILGLRY